MLSLLLSLAFLQFPTLVYGYCNYVNQSGLIRATGFCFPVSGPGVPTQWWKLKCTSTNTGVKLLFPANDSTCQNVVAAQAANLTNTVWNCGGETCAATMSDQCNSTTAVENWNPNPLGICADSPQLQLSFKYECCQDGQSVLESSYFSTANCTGRATTAFYGSECSNTTAHQAKNVVCGNSTRVFCPQLAPTTPPTGSPTPANPKNSVCNHAVLPSPSGAIATDICFQSANISWNMLKCGPGNTTGSFLSWPFSAGGCSNMSAASSINFPGLAWFCGGENCSFIEEGKCNTTSASGGPLPMSTCSSSGSNSSTINECCMDGVSVLQTSFNGPGCRGTPKAKFLLKPQCLPLVNLLDGKVFPDNVQARNVMCGTTSRVVCPGETTTLTPGGSSTSAAGSSGNGVSNGSGGCDNAKVKTLQVVVAVLATLLGLTCLAGIVALWYFRQQQLSGSYRFMDDTPTQA